MHTFFIRRVLRGVVAITVAFVASAPVLTGPSALAQTSDNDRNAPGSQAYAVAHGAVATYHGGRINLAEGWQGAQVCVEDSPTNVNCYDSDAAFRRAAGLPTARLMSVTIAAPFPDCPYPYACVYENINYGGRHLIFHDPGKHDFGRYGFRDKTSSAANDLQAGGEELTDFRTLQFDDHIVIGLGQALPSLGKFNDRADRMEL